jgi:hypothetical protein
MPTANVNASTNWTKVADASNTELLITWSAPGTIEVATTAADSAPTVNGHRLTRESAITRAAIGAGFVWVRSLSAGSAPELAVSK